MFYAVIGPSKRQFEWLVGLVGTRREVERRRRNKILSNGDTISQIGFFFFFSLSKVGKMKMIGKWNFLKKLTTISQIPKRLTDCLFNCQDIKRARSSRCRCSRLRRRYLSLPVGDEHRNLRVTQHQNGPGTPW